MKKINSLVSFDFLILSPRILFSFVLNRKIHSTLLGQGFLSNGLCYMHQDEAGKKLSTGRTPCKTELQWCKALGLWAPGQTTSSLLLKSSDPRRPTQLKDPERGPPLPKEPTNATWSQHGTSQSLPSNIHHAALGRGQPRSSSNRQPQPKGKSWRKIILGEAPALGASSSWSCPFHPAPPIRGRT